MKHETAGDPVTGLKWTRRTTAKIATELSCLGIAVSDRSVAKLLRQMKFSLRVNHKKLARVCALAPQERDAQFAHIAQLREQFATHKLPLISVDTKKKEMVGWFKNAGQAWNREPICVNDHDFRSDADGMAIPYGVYDLLANRGTVFVGTSHDTPEFAARSIATWWRYEGCHRYAHADRIGILADSGGSNSPTCRAWKYHLHRQLAQRYGLLVTVAHYPSGASKWNPIEHRLFSEISKNWAGRPLDSYDTILNYLRTTSTTTGLQVRAHLLRKDYEKGVKISDDQMQQLPIHKDASLPKWNYTISPD
jgi:Rhodopirellula transposase DDE domain